MVFTNENQIIFLWGRGAAGSAFEWHSKGRGFDPHRLHHIYLEAR